jgi:hypothetical protein
LGQHDAKPVLGREGISEYNKMFTADVSPQYFHYHIIVVNLLLTIFLAVSLESEVLITE